MAKLCKDLKDPLMSKRYDADFVRLLASGDEETFKVMVRHIYPSLHKTALRMLDSDEEADEVIQETLITVWLKRSQMHKVENLQFFLFKMVRNRAIYHIRRRQREAKFRDNYCQEDFAPPPDTLLEDIESARYIDYTLESLPHRQREVFMLSRERNLTHKQIAKELNISVHTVHNHMKAALQRFRSRLADYNCEP